MSEPRRSTWAATAAATACSSSLSRAGERPTQFAWIVAVEETGVGLASDELGVAEHPDEQVPVGGDTMDLGAGKRRRQDRNGLGAGGGMGYHLGKHRVVVDGHVGPVLDTGVHPDPPVGDAEAVQRPGGGEEVGGGILS